MPNTLYSATNSPSEYSRVLASVSPPGGTGRLTTEATATTSGCGGDF